MIHNRIIQLMNGKIILKTIILVLLGLTSLTTHASSEVLSFTRDFEIRVGQPGYYGYQKTRGNIIINFDKETKRAVSGQIGIKTRADCESNGGCWGVFSGSTDFNTIRKIYPLDAETLSATQLVDSETILKSERKACENARLFKLPSSVTITTASVNLSVNDLKNLTLLSEVITRSNLDTTTSIQKNILLKPTFGDLTPYNISPVLGEVIVDKTCNW